jgi:hypothetical protein
MNQNDAPEALSIVENIRRSKPTTVQTPEEYYLFPHEFLCLVCNAKDRIRLLNGAFRLNFALNKHEHFNNPGDQQKPQDRFIVYDLTK